MSAAIELTNFRSHAQAQAHSHAQVAPQPKKKIIIKKYTFSCGDVVYLPEGKPVTHICKRKKKVETNNYYLVDDLIFDIFRQRDEYRARGGPTLYDDFRSSFTDKDLKYILSNKN
jgi:hypothetical protein